MDTDTDLSDQIEAFLEENEELTTRLLAHGSPEAQGRVLALYANAGRDRIDAAIEQLEAIKDEKEGSP